jgi:ankyrin repeat protein
VLGAAVLSGDAWVVARILAGGADPDAPADAGYTAAMIAARMGAEETLIGIVNAGADVNRQAESDGSTALYWAANRGLLDGVRRLLAAGARADIRTRDGETASQAAAMAGEAEIAELIDSTGRP